MLNLAQIELLEDLLDMSVKALDHEHKDGQYDSETVGDYIYKLSTMNPELVVYTREALNNLKIELEEPSYLKFASLGEETDTICKEVRGKL